MHIKQYGWMILMEVSTISANLKELFFSSEDFLTPGMAPCQGCPGELALRTVLRVMGKDTVLGVTPGCMTSAVGYDRKAGVKIPVTMPLLDNAASVLSGVKRYYDKVGKNNINVVAFTGDGASADAGFQSLSGAAERNENIIYICYDNEGYMNTGFQRSGTSAQWSHTSTTPVGKVVPGKLQAKKDMPMIMAMHDVAYVATISPAYTKDFVTKLEKAKSIKDGFVYLHIFSPCVSGWGCNSDEAIKVAKAAVQTNYFPLYEYEGGKFKQTVIVKTPKPVEEFTGLLKKFNHIGQKELNDIQSWVNRRVDILHRLCAE